MTPELWQRLKPLYDAALETPVERRTQFLSEACGHDRELREELAALLKAGSEPTGLCDAPIISFRDLFPGRGTLFSIGELVLGRFKVVRHIGTGGMGEVYEAMDVELGRIALKTVRHDMSGSPDALARFRKEVQLARKITDPHVCRIHELFVIASSAKEPQKVFLTMEFLDGVTLADKMEGGAPLPWAEARLIALQICDGLRAIHEAGIIHRDLKNRNIMLACRNGSTCAVLMDFGLAREFVTPTSATVTGVSASGAIAGTPDYMAPEQFAGKELTPATDVYALGIVLYKLVTGKHPFVASSLVSAAIERGQPPCLASSVQSGLPRHCDEIICKCLEYDPRRRYQSADEVKHALVNRSVLSGLRSGWVRSIAGIVGITLVLSCLLLIPTIGERVRGILFSSHDKHIAVLPFDVAEHTADTEALADGLMDSLAGKISNLDAANQSLWVVPASEVRRRKVDDPSRALREFGATIVVKGSFERSNHSMHLKLTLIDPKRMREIGFVDVENQAGDLAALQDEAVTRLGRLINISVEKELLQGRTGQVTRAAYEDYLIGLGYLQRFDKAGNLDLAIASFSNAVKTDPRFALGLARLGQAYVLRYRIDANTKWLEHAKLYARRAAELDDRVALTYVALGSIHEHTGEHDLAVQEFQHALDLDPRNSEALAGLALSYQSEGHYSEAEAAYIKAAALRPDDWSGYNSLANFYSQTGRFQEAIEQFRRAVALTPDNAGLYANLGSAYLNSGNPKMVGEAETALKRSIAMSPSFQAYANLGNLYGVQHRFHESIAASRKALQLNDENYDVWNNLAEGYEWVDDVGRAESARKKALELAERAVKQNPQDADAQSTLAALLAKDGRKDEALDKIRICLALSSDSQYVLSNIADAYALLGNHEYAMKYLYQALTKGFPPEQLKSDPLYQRYFEGS